VVWASLGECGGLMVTADAEYAGAVLRRRVKDLPFLNEQRLEIGKKEGLVSLLSALPITNKTTLSVQGVAMYTQPESSIALFSETAGTTGGAPILTPRGREELRWNELNQAAAYRRHLHPGKDRVAILHPVILSPFAEVSAAALARLGVGYLRLFPIPRICDYERIARVLEEYDVTAVMTTPTLAYKVLFELSRLGRLPSSVDKLLLTGEVLSRDSLANLDRIIGKGPGVARSFVYGSSEAATLMYGVKDGTYRGFLDDFLFEVLPIEQSSTRENTCSRSEEAVTGRLLVTWLREGVMPLVRYDTGDVFSVRSDSTTGEWVFESHGRGHPQVTPEMMARVEQVCFGTATPVFHYDLQVEASRVTVSLFCSGGKTEMSLLRKEVEKGIESIFRRVVEVYLNPEAHTFLDFSPRAKSQHISFQD